MKYYKLLTKRKYSRDLWVVGKIYSELFSPTENGVNVDYIVNKDKDSWIEVTEKEYLEQEGLNGEFLPVTFFEKELTLTLESIQKTLGQKGKEYSTNFDKFHNFNEGAKILGCIPEKCLDAYMTKHIVSYRDMLNRLQNGEIPSDELIDEKLGDIINYFILQKIQLKQRNSK